MSSPSSIIVLLPEEGESWNVFLERLRKTGGEVLAVVVDRDEDLEGKPDLRKQLVEACRGHGACALATKLPSLAREAREAGVRAIDRTRDIRRLLSGHPLFNEVFRVFSPHQWKQQLKSRLQRMGLLSVPKLRIYLLALLSCFLFFIVVFRLLPSAEITVSPRQETVSNTANIYLAASGASAFVPTRLRTLPLLPLSVGVRKAVVSDHVSKGFIGTTAQVKLSVVNTTKESYTLRSGTRFTNEGGMVFRIQESVTVPASAQKPVLAKADELDLYGQIIGDRGNVPAGLTWKVPGLPEDVRSKVYAKNTEAGKGGTTAYRTILKQEDLDLARKRLEQELLKDARDEIERMRKQLNADEEGNKVVIFSPQKYPELARITYSGMLLPVNKLGQSVPSVTASGAIRYTVYAYDAQEILEFLRQEMMSHVREDRRLLEESIGLDRLVIHVIDYADDLSWIKLTVDLTATEQYVLDPLSPQGAIFAKRVREQVAGLPRDRALRQIRNMPEVENVQIRQWPPWNRSLPVIPSHISVAPE